MNIFYLDSDPEVCAQNHVDKHVVKMILECAQLLCTTQRLMGNDHPDLYKKTHVNHPSAQWVRYSQANYVWLYRLFVALLDEYTYRYCKIHASARLLALLKTPPKSLPCLPFFPPWRVMPDSFKLSRDTFNFTVLSYRAYYKKDKLHLFTWTRRAPPEWCLRPGVSLSETHSFG